MCTRAAAGARAEAGGQGQALLQQRDGCCVLPPPRCSLRLLQGAVELQQAGRQLAGIHLNRAAADAAAAAAAAAAAWQGESRPPAVHLCLHGLLGCAHASRCCCQATRPNPAASWPAAAAAAARLPPLLATTAAVIPTATRRAPSRRERPQQTLRPPGQRPQVHAPRQLPPRAALGGPAHQRSQLPIGRLLGPGRTAARAVPRHPSARQLLLRRGGGPDAVAAELRPQRWAAAVEQVVLQQLLPPLLPSGRQLDVADRQLLALGQGPDGPGACVCGRGGEGVWEAPPELAARGGA
jgi:hypothetical protein